MAQLAKKYPDDLQIVFKHNPLHFHPKALPAAIASMAAANQGKFWEFHDKLWEKQKELSDELYPKLAEELGLDLEQFEKDRKDPAIAARIEHDQSVAEALGARGTPAFFINGINLSGAKPLEEFTKVIDAEIEKANALEKSGIAVEKMHKLLAKKNPKTEAYVKYWIDGKAPPKRQAQPDKKKAEQKKEPEDTTTVWRVRVRSDDPVKGPAFAPVTIVEFSDFECPFCTKVNPTIKKVMETYGDKVRVIFKHNPLSFHKSAKLAAEATLAAHAQGKFWEMHDMLFENQKALLRADIEGYAEKLGLDVERFKRELDEGVYSERVDQDQELSGEVNAKGTPNLFVNGRQFTGAKTFEDLKPAIDEEIKKSEALLAKGTKLEDLYDGIVARGKAMQALDPKSKPSRPRGPTRWAPPARR